MKFTILSHAGLAVEHRGVRLVCDPWLLGSCYWRSWWNFPEPDPNLIRNLEPRYIYLTHLHWDHFHGPSLKKLFDRKTTILVPKVPTRRMLEDLNWLGFHDVIEIPHGSSFKLGEDFELRSYQFGFGVDSGALISGGGQTVFNCNDCKFFGLPLKQILNSYPKLDFILRSHSSASPIPLCVENHEALFERDEANYDSADQFARCALYSGARYAVPFASNHCFLHPETRRFNATVTTPELARRRYAALAADSAAATECIVMPPGSSWSDTEGFKVARFDFEQRDAYVQGMLERNAAKLEAQRRLEAESRFDPEAFQAYFARFLGALPWIIRNFRLAPVVFLVRDAHGNQCWRVEPKHRRVSCVPEARADEVVFDVHAAVLNDCASLKMFSVWTASKRLKIRLPSTQALAQANLWFTLFDLYETDILPLRKNFTLRSLGVRLRRWREPAELFLIGLRRLFLRQRFSVSRIYPPRPARAS